MTETDVGIIAGMCAGCETHIEDVADVFCSSECAHRHVAGGLRALTRLQAKDAPREITTAVGSLVPPGWVKAQRWFYFVDARQPDVACFGTLEDAQRCVDDGGWPCPIVTDEGRAFEKRVDAVALWHVKRARGSVA